MFALPLLVSIRVLIPEQPRVLLGLELVVTGLLAAALMLWLHRPSNRVERETRTNSATETRVSAPNAPTASPKRAPRRRGHEPGAR
jgi:hypothetical protein